MHGPTLESSPTAKPAAFLLAIFLAGCSAPPKQALDAAAAKDIRSIALVEVREPSKYVALNIGHAGLLFGAIGGAIAGASMEQNGGKLTAAFRGNGFEFGKRFSEKTASVLIAHGYQVMRVREVRASKEDKLDYSRIQTDADAILSVTPTVVGYVSPLGHRHYLPALGVVVELVRRRPDQVSRLYYDRFMFGWEPATSEWIHVAAPTAYRYASFDELMSRNDQAAEGLGLGIDAVAERLAKDLFKKP